ncbi:hypothetical protein ABID42_001903 [Arcicella rosea]|uniref:hypothetical protein n=1 Tax=Arcicella rosea TaxID=502909 RepID=UPI00345DE4A0
MRYIKHKEKFDWDVKNGGKFNRFFIKRYLATLGLEDFRTLGETKEARDKRQDLGLGIWDLGLEDFRTLRLKKQETRGKIWDWKILGL